MQLSWWVFIFVINDVSDIIPKLPKLILDDMEEMERAFKETGWDLAPSFDVFDAHVKEAMISDILTEEEGDRLLRRYGYR